MPKVARVSGTSAQLQLGPQPQAQAPSTNTQEIASQATGRLGEVFARIQDQEQVKVDRTKLSQAQTAAINTETDLLWSPKTGAYTRKGEGAFNSVATTLPVYRQSLDQIAGTLTSERQRAAWAEFRADRESNVTAGLNRHEMTQTDVVHSTTAAAAAATWTDFAARNAGDPKQVEYALSRILEVQSGELNRIGAPKEVRDQATATATSAVRGTVVEHLSDADRFDEAKAYLNQHRAEMGEKDIDRSEKMIKIGEDQLRARRHQDYTWGLQLKNERERDNYEQLSRIVAAGGTLKPSQLIDTPPEYRNALEAQMRGDKVVTDITRLEELYKMYQDDPEALLNVDLAQERGRLSDADMHGVLNLKSKIRYNKSTAEDRSKVNNSLGNMAAIRSMALPILYPTRDKAGILSVEQNNEYNLLAPRIAAQIDEATDPKTGKIDGAKRDEIIRAGVLEQWKLKTTFDAGFFGSNLTIEQMDPVTRRTYVPEDDELPPLDVIPSAVVEELRANAKRISDRQLTDVQIRRLYIKRMMTRDNQAVEDLMNVMLGQ